MADLQHAMSFRELIVYQKSAEIAGRVYEISKRFPKDEKFALTDQIRRASRSIGAQVAEAWGKRRYERHFLSKLTDADAEQLETQHWIDVSFSCGYLSRTDAAHILERLQEIGKMLNSMMNKSRQFCSQIKPPPNH